MASFIDTLLTIIICFLVWVAYSGIIMVHIRLEAKKKWKKNEEQFPYFHYPFYKKLFLLGLKGCINTSIVVVSFILNISVLLILCLGIWHLIVPNIYLSYCLRLVVGIYGVSFILKLILFLCMPLRFK